MSKTRRDFLIVDLDETLWDGVLGEDSGTVIPQGRVAVLEDLESRGICSCIVSNNSNKNLVIEELQRNNVPRELFVGILFTSVPKGEYLRALLGRLHVKWSRVAIVDDDPVVRGQVEELGGAVFSSFEELADFDWDSSHPKLHRRHRERRKLARKYAVNLATLTPEDLSGTDLVSYLEEISLRVRVSTGLEHAENRVAELLYRSTQMQFNKPEDQWTSIDDARRAVQLHLANGGLIATAEVSADGNNLGIQGVMLYSVPNTECVVSNAAFSCSVLPYRLVEPIVVAEFAKKAFALAETVSFEVKIGDNNRRVAWLLEDLGAERVGDHHYEFSKRIPIPRCMDFTVDEEDESLPEDGVPPITTFYDDNVVGEIARLDRGAVLDIGYGFGEILGERRNAALTTMIEVRKGAITRADIDPSSRHVVKLDVTKMDDIPESHFDAIFCLELLEHVRKPQSGFFEILRVLNAGGLLFLSVPGPGYPHHAFSEDHNRFSEEFLRALFKPYGVILELHRQAFAGIHVRTIVLFRKTRNPGRATLSDFFDKNDKPSVLPNNLRYFGSPEVGGSAFAAAKACLLGHYWRKVYIPREHYRIVLGLVGAVIGISALFIANHRLRLSVLATEHSTISSMLMTDEYRSDGIALVPQFQRQAAGKGHHFNRQLASLCARSLWDLRIQNASLAGLDLSIGEERLTVRGTELTFVDLSESDFSRTELKWITALECKISGMSMDDAVLVGGKWQLYGENASLKRLMIRGTERNERGFIISDYSVWSRSALEGCDFSEADLMKTAFNDVEFVDCKFDGARFNHCSFSSARLVRVSFEGCTFNACFFEGAVLEDCTFDGCEIYGNSSFKGADVGMSSFDAAELINVDFGGATVNKDNARFSALRELGAVVE